MMKYRDHNSHIASAIGAGVELAGMRAILAKNTTITDELGTNVMATLLCCKYGIALFDEPEKKQEINPNVAFELGIMHFLDRPCLLLKSKKVPSLQTDILAKLYTQYDPAKVGTSVAWLEGGSWQRARPFKSSYEHGSSADCDTASSYAHTAQQA